MKPKQLLGKNINGQIYSQMIINYVKSIND